VNSPPNWPTRPSSAYAVITFILLIVVIVVAVALRVATGDLDGAFDLARKAGITIGGGILFAFALTTALIPAELRRRRVAKTAGEDVALNVRLVAGAADRLSAVAHALHWDASNLPLGTSFTVTASGSGISFWAGKRQSPVRCGTIAWELVHGISSAMPDSYSYGRALMQLRLDEYTVVRFFLATERSFGMFLENLDGVNHAVDEVNRVQHRSTNENWEER
jgi:hypothetical protein